MQTIDEFIRRHPDLTIRVSAPTHVPAYENESEWEHHRYRVQLRMAGRSMQMAYRKGAGHRGNPPQLDEILDSIRSDCLDADEPFEVWAREFGFDTDSRKAYAMWEECVKARRRASAFFTEPELQLLLECEGL